MTVGLGCMRLSTEVDRDDARSADVLAAALDAGVDLFDTADAYALSDDDLGHNERLLAAAIRGRNVTVVTKGGLTRPGGAWVPNGRAKHLAAAARASRDRLGVAAIDLYLLHAVDPKTPLATSVRALARLRDDGVVNAIGLSNVTPTQLAEALAIAPIEAVEVELHPYKLDAIRGGLVELCAQRGIRVLAHRPLGGPAGVKRLARDAALRAIAARHDATTAEVALAWLRSLAPVIVPIPGATRVETVRSAARACTIVLDDAARATLAETFLVVRGAPGTTDSIRGARDVGGTRTASPIVELETTREVVVIMGMPASGKSTLAEDYVARGYVRLNRDERGGSLLDLARSLDRELASGTARIVVDNTYGTRAQRAPVVEVARRRGAAIRCVALATTLEEAQANAVMRILERHGRLLGPEELRGEIRPNVQFRWRREYEPPRTDEGFASVDEVRPARRSTGTQRALIVELDEIVWRGRPRSASAIELFDGAAEALRAWAEDPTDGASEPMRARAADPIDGARDPMRARTGHPIAGTLWRPGADVATLEGFRAWLGERGVELLACTHPPGPPICWCRKPLPGLGLAFSRARDVDVARSVHIGRGPADRGFAQRVGLAYADIAEGWPRP